MVAMKKILSLLITISLMTGITNIPVYAGGTAISAGKTTDAVLSQTYYTPAQLAKQVIAKPKATVAKTTKAKATKKVSLMTKIKKQYGANGLTLIKKLANKLSLTISAVYSKFVIFDITTKHINKVYSTIIKQIKKGVGFVNCASLAVAKYLGISRKSAALQNLLGDITSGDFLVNNSKTFKGIIGTGEGSTITLRKNGKKVENYNVTLKTFMNNLKNGDKALLSVECYNKKGNNVGEHAITIKKEKNGYGVFDTLSNDGEEVIYSKKEFEKFMNGKAAVGKTKKGKTIKKTVYYTNTTSGTIRYKPLKNKKIDVTTDSKNLIKAANNGYVRTVKNIDNKLIKVDFNKFMDDLKIGETTTVKVKGFDFFYNGGIHYITVSKEKDGFGVIDVNVNGGKKVIYDENSFYRLLVRQKTTLTGKDVKTGKNIKVNTYYGTGDIEHWKILCTPTKGLIKNSYK